MRRARAIGAAAAVLLAGGAAAGCGLSIGGTAHTRSVPPAATHAVVARAQRTHELPTSAAPETAPGGWRSPVQAVQVFTETYINWTATTIATHLRLLAEASIGQARSAMTLAAGQAGRDSDLQRGGIANAGTVEAIAPVTGERDVYAVVTRERTTATNTSAYRGLAPAWHVTLATVTQVDGGLWTLSGWQPES
ncbi:MAG: hypothetical protein ACXVRW_01615 [Solirubrobacteraceae bacterium]